MKTRIRKSRIKGLRQKSFRRRMKTVGGRRTLANRRRKTKLKNLKLKVRRRKLWRSRLA